VHALSSVSPRPIAAGTLFVSLLLAACSGAASAATPTGDASLARAATPTSGTAPALSAPSQVPEAQIHPLAGLTFGTTQGFWLVDAQGVPQLLVDQSRGHLSSDGQRLVYQAPGPQGGADDIWTMDLANGERRDLTNTAERFEEDPQWWPGRADTVVFSSDLHCCMASRALPTLIGVNGTGYTIVDEQNGGPRALSPNGQLMAYSAYQRIGWLYRFGQSPEPFDSSAYGLRVERLIQPAFSPDGRALAWTVSGDFDGNGSSDLAVALFDLEAKNGRLIHRYTSTAGGEFPSDIAWSPDGQWLAFVTFGEPPASGRIPNLWVARAEGSQEKYLAAGSSPVWNPDSQSLAFLEASVSGQPEPRLANMTTFTVEPFPAALPTGILFLLDWVRP
jgi:hypothetical protein